MKKTGMIAVMVAVVCFAGIAGILAGVTNTPSAYFANYKMTPGTNTSSGGTGLTTGAIYACFLVSDIDNLTGADAHQTTGNVSTIIYALTKEFFDQLDGYPSTNRPTSVTMTENISAGSATSVTVDHKVKTILTIDTSSVTTE